MSGWLRHLTLTLKAKTGLSSGVAVWTLVAIAAGAGAIAFFIIAAFIALAQRYGALTAALALGGLFLLFTIIAAIACILTQRRTAADAKLELAARSHAVWLDPKLVRVGLQIGQTIGWRRLVPLAAAGVLAAGLAKEWFSRGRSAGETG
jgi:Ca2+/Na+ antiporter